MSIVQQKINDRLKIFNWFLLYLITKKWLDSNKHSDEMVLVKNQTIEDLLFTSHGVVYLRLKSEKSIYISRFPSKQESIIV